MNREILEYDFDYHATQEIQHIAMGAQELRCRRSVEKERLHNNASSQINWLEQAKRSAKYELLDMISDFILVKEIHDGFYIEAELYLPYVRDSKITELEKDIKLKERQVINCSSHISSLNSEIQKLQRPWWKKLIDSVKRKGNQ